LIATIVYLRVFISSSQINEFQIRLDEAQELYLNIMHKKLYEEKIEWIEFLTHAGIISMSLCETFCKRKFVYFLYLLKQNF